MSRNVFPTTRGTWIGELLGRGGSGRAELNAYLMQTYAHPLTVYYLGTNLRWLGEPDDIINGFFASRLDDSMYLDKWHASGLRLRRWLMNGLCLFLRELLRSRARDRAKGAEYIDEEITFDGDPEAAVDRAAATAFVRQAIELAGERCATDGLEDHWTIFLQHEMHGTSFADLAREFDVAESRAAVMSRTAKRKFSKALRDVLLRDGVPEARLDDEITALLEAFSA